MKIYHGTSYEQAQKILNEGFQNVPTNWEVSLENETCFHYDREDEDYARIAAIDSGRIAAALNHSKSEDIYVISIDIDESLIDKYPDLSCDNSYLYALAIPHKILCNFELNFERISKAFVPSLSLSYLFSVYENINKQLLTDLEYEILESKTARNLFSGLIYEVLDY